MLEALSSIDLGDWLGIVGIAIALVQIARTRSAVRQTQRAVENASITASVYNVLAISPRMSNIDTQLEYAARGNDFDGFTAALRSYKELAAELDGLLHQEEKHGAQAQLALQKALTLAATAKLPIGGASLDLYDKTKSLRRAVSESTVEVTRMTARLRSDLTPPQVERENILRAIWSGRRESGGTNG